ncbi:MAG: BrnT family toxin [Chloroflexi bacterium]|nr:BrnT family toxin [Chloroflexota bacterium]
MSLTFEWDEQKRQTNIRKHGFDFRDVWQVFNAPMLVALDERQEYGEERWIGVGALNGRVVVVIFTERGENLIRIISMMKAVTQERINYEQLLRDQLGND